MHATKQDTSKGQNYTGLQPSQWEHHTHDLWLMIFLFAGPDVTLCWEQSRPYHTSTASNGHLHRNCFLFLAGSSSPLHELQGQYYHEDLSFNRISTSLNKRHILFMYCYWSVKSYGSNLIVMISFIWSVNESNRPKDVVEWRDRKGPNFVWSLHINSGKIHSTLSIVDYLSRKNI